MEMRVLKFVRVGWSGCAWVEPEDKGFGAQLRIHPTSPRGCMLCICIKMPGCMELETSGLVGLGLVERGEQD